MKADFIFVLFFVVLAVGCTSKEDIGCTQNSDCTLPGSFAVKSDCKYEAKCYQGECITACPALNQPECENDDLCDCSSIQHIDFSECLCIDSTCYGQLSQ